MQHCFEKRLYLSKGYSFLEASTAAGLRQDRTPLHERNGKIARISPLTNLKSDRLLRTPQRARQFQRPQNMDLYQWQEFSQPGGFDSTTIRSLHISCCTQLLTSCAMCRKQTQQRWHVFLRHSMASVYIVLNHLSNPNLPIVL